MEKTFSDEDALWRRRSALKYRKSVILQQFIHLLLNKRCLENCKFWERYPTHCTKLHGEKKRVHFLIILEMQNF